MAIKPGHELSHYRLIEKIGEGGMGVVWKARDTSASRRPLMESGRNMMVESFGISPDGSIFALSTIRQRWAALSSSR